ncbi:hypothetical protein Cgig2_017243 [Carnegiea gigantea]|uniref:Reverse transcriptase zinc-binding domain-containing protein n=1 Tax=Carnegiea gigantea TaxID=171969 RepID=A0A9Q1GXB0_9CARY|nr:hypothetical protein Cgig2_017243 [Carnegiea gigantea]
MGIFTVRSTYHMRLNWADAMSSSSENKSKEVWKMLWALDVPPRIRLFGWRMCLAALPSRLNIAKRVPSFGMSCATCAAAEESDVHVLLECPLAVAIWESSPVERRFWDVKVKLMVDCVELAMTAIDRGQMGEFWPFCGNVGTLETWGLWEGGGFVIRSSDGDIVLAGVEQGGGFGGPEVEEAKACLFGIKCTHKAGLDNLVIEGDCLALIQKLKQSTI